MTELELSQNYHINVTGDEEDYPGVVTVTLPSIIDIPPAAARAFAELLLAAADRIERSAASANP